MSTSRLWRALTVFAVALAVTVALFFAIRHYGEGRAATGAGAPLAKPSPPSAASGNVLLHVLVALGAIIVASRGLGILCRRFGQPPVIGEVVAGILLGPSLLGRVSPHTMAFLFPADILPHLAILAQLGVVAYMFLVGLELKGDLLRSQAQTTVLISQAGIAAPFVLGAGLALWLHGALAPTGVSFTSFALFLGVAMAITAFPVLARVLTDLGLAATELGRMALTCAAVGDVTAWCLLAIAIGVAQARIGGALTTVVLTILFVALMLFGIAPLARRWLRFDRDLPASTSATGAVLFGLLAAAAASEAIGIHAVFGAFLLGAVIPAESSVARRLPVMLEGMVAILLPAFFAFTGMRTEIGLVHGGEQWLVCGAIIAIATLGKFGGVMIPARLSGMPWRTSAALGALMNARGLMELIVLNIGLDLGVISPTLFAMMVLMALTTTVMTTPIVLLLVRRTPAAVTGDESGDAEFHAAARHGSICASASSTVSHND